MIVESGIEEDVGKDPGPFATHTTKRRHLRVLPREQVTERPAIVLAIATEDNGPCWHVHPHCKGLSRHEHLHNTFGEQYFHLGLVPSIGIMGVGIGVLGGGFSILLGNRVGWRRLENNTKVQKYKSTMGSG